MAEKKRKSSRGTAAYRAMKAVVDAKARVAHLEQRKAETASSYDDKIAAAQTALEEARKAFEPFKAELDL